MVWLFCEFVLKAWEGASINKSILIIDLALAGLQAEALPTDEQGFPCQLGKLAINNLVMCNHDISTVFLFYDLIAKITFLLNRNSGRHVQIKHLPNDRHSKLMIEIV